MKKTGWLLLLCASGLAAADAADRLRRPGDPEAQTVYGDDDRLDLYQVQDPNVLALADSTAALFRGGSISLDGAGRAKLSLRHYGQSNNLCAHEPFYDQKEGAFCSGFLVGPDLFATAGHCVTSNDACKTTKFVFGWGITRAGASTPESVPAAEVYDCKELLGRHQDAKGPDWAVLRLDRAVTNHRPLKINRANDIANGTKLLMIGNPSGLPTKVAGGNTYVLDASPNGWFAANTDSYHGNSGSAVFNQATGLIEGILVRGDNDYERVPGPAAGAPTCYVSKKCPEDGKGCRKEDVTKISAASIPVPDEPVASLRSPAKARVRTMLSRPDPAFAELIEQARSN